MGRAKLPIRLINPERSRHATFTKRKRGLKKKIFEFATLCDVDACMIIYGSAAGSAPETWPEDPTEVRRIIERFGKAPAEERDKRRVDVSAFLTTKNKKLQAELERKREENAELASLLLWNRTSLDAMDLDTVLGIERRLHAKITAVHERIESLRRNVVKREDECSQLEMPIKGEFSQHHHHHHRLEYVPPLHYGIPPSFIVPPLQLQAQPLALPQGGNACYHPVASSGQGMSLVDPLPFGPAPDYCKSIMDPILFGHEPDYCSYLDPIPSFLPGTYDGMPVSFSAMEDLDPLTGPLSNSDPIQGFED
ncbi:MADS-box transcription factor PHERES 2-like [Nymphaea colorata]|uniref:MADS-box domain-containing protein n=1 Tax=Nymphaea colorata TaxID=210225 RepID=A0A5K0VMJ7_9MAGN|nr:MADS-box transcription factor PHERES 2-like [Nymphaea colorata]